MRIKHHAGAVSLVHDGETFLADADGYIDAPFELAQTLLALHVWDTEVAEVYIAPEQETVAPETPVNPVAAAAAAALAEAEATPAEDRTPYQKGLLTRAANEAAKAAEAKAK